jgi:acyl carrier protein
MEPSMIAAKVKDIIGTVTGVAPDSIDDSATFVDDLGLDSLAILEVVVDVENTFKVHATDDELQNVRNVNDCVTLILQQTCAQVASSAAV